MSKSKPSSLSLAARLALLSAFLAIPASSPGQGGSGAVYVPIVRNHDFDSATTTYAVLGPLRDGAALGLPKIKTTGSSATIDAASGTPFDVLVSIPGDVIVVTPSVGGAVAPQERYVLTRPSGAQITVNAVADWSANGATGFSFSYRNLSQGTGAGAGWFSVSGIRSPVLYFQIEQLSLASGSLAVVVECKGPDPWATPNSIYPPTGGSGQCGTGLFTVAGATARCQIVIHEQADAMCRFGVSLTDDGGDTGANLERVTAYLTGFK